MGADVVDITEELVYKVHLTESLMHVCNVCALLVYAAFTEGNYTNQDISQASLNKFNIPLTLLSEVHTWGSSSNFPSCLFHRLMALYFLPRSASRAAARRGKWGWNSLAVHCSRDGHTSFCSLYVIFMRIYRLDSQWENSLSASPALSFSVTLSGHASS